MHYDCIILSPNSLSSALRGHGDIRYCYALSYISSIVQGSVETRSRELEGWQILDSMTYIGRANCVW